MVKKAKARTIVIDGEDLCLGASAAVAITKGGPTNEKAQAQSTSPHPFPFSAFHPGRTSMHKTGCQPRAGTPPVLFR